MVTIPSFLLRRLYVQGSLLNADHGVQFQLLNKMGTGYARRLLPLDLDGQEVPIASCAFQVDGKEYPFSDISASAPFALDLNKATVVTIAGVTLTKEPHTIGMGFEVPGLGVLKFDFTDVPSDG